ncbi:hypothetical protein BJ970_000026 [Saccharopolyspora phatthalungensis]|uniref:Uncharacterized protein n=1 Tax=Saccharopolyspora phatthalungensis TaxID=664693 RepID=A0A840PQB4_9PSEU|nr:hypothetical protein [Saccharopolyspora phatthalungensis]
MLRLTSHSVKNPAQGQDFRAILLAREGTGMGKPGMRPRAVARKNIDSCP